MRPKCDGKHQNLVEFDRKSRNLTNIFAVCKNSQSLRTMSSKKRLKKIFSKKNVFQRKKEASKFDGKHQNLMERAKILRKAQKCPAREARRKYFFVGVGRPVGGLESVVRAHPLLSSRLLKSPESGKSPPSLG